jgi:hypothetical protein
VKVRSHPENRQLVLTGHVPDGDAFGNCWLAYLGLGRPKYVNVCNLWDSRKRLLKHCWPLVRWPARAHLDRGRERMSKAALELTSRGWPCRSGARRTESAKLTAHCACVRLRGRRRAWPCGGRRLQRCCLNNVQSASVQGEGNGKSKMPQARLQSESRTRGEAVHKLPLKRSHTSANFRRYLSVTPSPPALPSRLPDAQCFARRLPWRTPTSSPPILCT